MPARFYLSIQFGDVRRHPATTGRTPGSIRGPLRSGEVYAYWMTWNCRRPLRRVLLNGILFNHESLAAAETFVTRKITMGVAAIKAGLTDELWLGNLDAGSRLGLRQEYVEAM